MDADSVIWNERKHQIESFIKNTLVIRPEQNVIEKQQLIKYHSGQTLLKYSYSEDVVNFKRNCVSYYQINN